MVHNNKLMNKKFNKMMKMDNSLCKKMISDIFVFHFNKIKWHIDLFLCFVV